jgi:hypothetical protein
VRAILVSSLILVCAGSASAQGTNRSRAAITVGAGYTPSPQTFSNTITFESFSEEGSLTTVYTPKKGPWIDTNAVIRVWRNLGASVGVSFLRGSTPAQITGSIPHPLQVNDPRTLNGTESVQHTETVVNLAAAYWFQPGGRTDVVVSAGASITSVSQDFVSDVTYSQTFPYDEVAYEGATVTRGTRTVVGVNIGMEIGYRLAGHVGVAGVARYSGGTTDFTDIGVSGFKLGGLRLEGGVRLLF